jgi:hypothetical protein
MPVSSIGRALDFDSRGCRFDPYTGCQINTSYNFKEQSMKLFEIFNLSSRESFTESWVKEMASGLGSFETYDAITYSIRDFLKNGLKPKTVKDDTFKIDVAQSVFYWVGTADGVNIKLAVELRKESEALVVTMLGKQRDLKGKPPFASDLYALIVKDYDENIRIRSDKFLSDEGYAVWKKLVSSGFKVSVYDADEPGKSFKTFDSPSELDSFFKHDDSDYERYQFVLSESIMNLMRVRSSFNLRKHRETVGIL